MELVVNDPTTVQQLRQAQSPIQLVDGVGNVIGHFVPALPAPPGPPLSDEELRRLDAQPGGRHLAEILADLERQHGV